MASPGKKSYPLRIDPANLQASCKAWYEDEISRPRPAGQRALIGRTIVKTAAIRFMA